MGSTDSIPIVSQVKSLVQAIGGDTEGARKTQENFLHTAPVVSQITSAVQAIEGDSEGAKDTQKEFVESLGHFADGIPVIGHIKGAIEYATGHKVAGDASMKASSRTIGVLAGGAAGFFAGGPAGAFLGGVSAGAAMDGIITGVDSAVHNEYRPYGEVSAVTNMVNGHYSIGENFDFVAGIGFDGLAGLGEAGDSSLTEITSEHLNGKPIYRVLNEEAAIKAIEDNAIPPPYRGGEVWIAESTEHSRAFVSGDAKNRTNVLEVKIDRDWYMKMREDNLIEQANASELGRGKNVWNDESGGGGHTGNRPGHGAVNIRIKHVQSNAIWGERGKGFDGFRNKLQNYIEALKKPELEVTEGNRTVSTRGRPGKEIKSVLGPMFGETGKEAPIVKTGSSLANGLETNFPYMQSAKDAAARIKADLAPLQDMADRYRVNMPEITVRPEDLGHIEALLNTVEEAVDAVRGSDNLSAFNSQVKSMRLIDPYRWKYKTGDWFKNWTRKHPKVYRSAVAISMGVQHNDIEEKRERLHNDEPLVSDCTIANTTQTYSAPKIIVIKERTDAKGPLMDEAITVGCLPVKRIQVKCNVQLTKQTSSNVECRLYLRLRKRDTQVNEFKDIDISGSITESKKKISFDDSHIGFEHIHLGGSIEFWCVVGTGRELTCTNLSCSVTFGDPVFCIETDGDLVKTIFKPRNVKLTDNNGKIIPLYDERIPLGVATIKSINVSFIVKVQGRGCHRGKVILRIWKNETTKTEFTDYRLTNSVLYHDWTIYNWRSEENHSIPIGAVAQLMCLVSHRNRLSAFINSKLMCLLRSDDENELYVKNLKLIITMGRPQLATVNTIDFVQHGLVEKNNVSDDYIDLYDEILPVSHDVKGIKVKFDAKNQGWGSRNCHVAMCVIKPSGKKKFILLHDDNIFDDWISYEYNSAKSLPFKIEAGDKIKFVYKATYPGILLYVVGGYRQLFVKNFYAVLNFHETTRIFAPAQDVVNKNSIDLLTPLYEHKLPCGVNAVTKVKITFEAKDQGSGNLKGRVYMRVFENGCKNVISDILVAKISHEWKSYCYESNDISEKIPTGSVIQFMMVVGGGGGHEVYVKNFVANITYLDSPRNETVSAFNEEIRCVAKLKQLQANGAVSKVVVNVVKPNGSIRTTFPLDKIIHEKKLTSNVAIGDKLKFVPKSSGTQGSFQVTASFLPLEVPDHHSVVIHFSPKLDFYGFVHGYGPQNILAGDNQRLKLKQKLRGLTVSCNWTDSNPDYNSTGKLYLVLKTNAGKEKGRHDVFGTVKHEWNHVMRVFASDDDLVKNAQPGDHILLLYEVGQNGVLHIDDLDIYMLLSE